MRGSREFANDYYKRNDRTAWKNGIEPIEYVLANMMI
jgi:hypothetical protein